MERHSGSGFAEWEAWIKTIEPLEYTAEERGGASERYRKESRRFNIEAVRKQMGLGDPA